MMRSQTNLCLKSLENDFKRLGSKLAKAVDVIYFECIAASFSIASRDKMGYSTPYEQWLSTSLQQINIYLSDSAIRKYFCARQSKQLKQITVISCETTLITNCGLVDFSRLSVDWCGNNIETERKAIQQGPTYGEHDSGCRKGISD